MIPLLILLSRRVGGARRLVARGGLLTGEAVQSVCWLGRRGLSGDASSHAERGCQITKKKVRSTVGDGQKDCWSPGRLTALFSRHKLRGLCLLTRKVVPCQQRPLGCRLPFSFSSVPRR